MEDNPLGDIGKLTAMLGKTIDGLTGMVTGDVLAKMTPEQRDEINQKMKGLSIDDVKDRLDDVDKEVIKMKDKFKDL